MPIHIQELTASVTVADGQPDHLDSPPPVAGAIFPATEDLTHWETIASEATGGTENEQTFARPTNPDSGDQTPTNAPAVGVDPAALYDRVLRLMLDDLTIARERE